MVNISHIAVKQSLHSYQAARRAIGMIENYLAEAERKLQMDKHTRATPESPTPLPTTFVIISCVLLACISMQVVLKLKQTVFMTANQSRRAHHEKGSSS